MATKKQKRQALQAKHDKFMSELKRSNQEALRKSQERREEENRRAWQDNHDKNHSWKKRIKECPHCQDAIKSQRRAIESSPGPREIDPGFTDTLIQKEN